MLNSLSLNFRPKALLLVLLWSLLVGSVFAQTTAFTYQGRLTDGGGPANGSYDLEFKLFNLMSSGTQQGSTQTLSNVTVTNGIFTVQLDFGTSVFTSNAGKFLEIGVRNAGVGGFTTLPQRQPVTSTPYAIQSLSATSATSFTGNLTGDVTGTQSATVVSNVGGQTAANVASGVSAANAATSANTSNTIVKRDGSGNFSAGTITAALNGNASTATTAGNVTGTVALTNGGTGAITAANARTNLGLGSLATVTPTGTANNTTFLRGDNMWAAPPTGSGVIYYSSQTNPDVPGSLFFPFAVGAGSLIGPSVTDLTTSIVPATMTIDTFSMALFYINATLPGTDNITVELIKNGSSTGMKAIGTSITTLNQRVSFNSTGGPVTFNAGDTICWKMTNTNSNPVVNARMAAHAQ